MHLNSLKALLCAVAVCFFSTTSVQAQALDILNPPIKVAAKKKSKKSGGGGGSNATFKPGSQETTKERSSRLSRECKGQTNAGACSGYTR